jgi:tetratricopeptide (TPR) repeat protein
VLRAWTAVAPTSIFDIALVHLSENQYPSAADELEKTTKLDPNAALAHVLLGRAYQNTNRSVQAIEQFRTALRLQLDITGNGTFTDVTAKAGVGNTGHWGTSAAFGDYEGDYDTIR